MSDEASQVAEAEDEMSKIILSPRRPKKKNRLSLMEERSRIMREKMTEGEKAMCSILESLGFNYEAQKGYLTEHNMGGFYIADFKISHNIIIEIDGRHHILDKEQFAYDRKRDEFFREKGFTTLRFSNTEVLKFREVIRTELSGIIESQLRQRERELREDKEKQLRKVERKKWKKLRKDERKKLLLERREKHTLEDKRYKRFSWKWKKLELPSPRELRKRRKV